MIVRVNELARTNFLSGKLRAPVGDHFIRVCVRARAGTGLKNVDRKMFIQFTVDHFFGSLDDQRRAFGIEQTEIMIGLRRGPLN